MANAGPLGRRSLSPRPGRGGHRDCALICVKSSGPVAGWRIDDRSRAAQPGSRRDACYDRRGPVCPAAEGPPGGPVSPVANRLGGLEGPPEAAHPDGAVVLHDLADLGLAQQVVGAEERTPRGPSGWWRRRRRGPGTGGCRRRLRKLAETAEQACGLCPGTACGRRGSSGKWSSGRHRTAEQAAAATSSWP